MKTPKKLIEVALPLDAINTSAAKEKSIRHGHPSTLHLYWARRPLAAARAVIFGQMVNDPSWRWEMENPGEVPPSHLKASWASSRRRLFSIIEELVTWENTTNEVVLEKARAEIRKSWRETCEVNAGHPRAGDLFDPDHLPGFHDPFAGGGALPLEAQRLGLGVCASDLNPVAVLINKAMIEIPPQFTGWSPVNPHARGEVALVPRTWLRADGLAEDIRHYASWIRDEAVRRIGHLYPQVAITAATAAGRPDLATYVGKQLPAIAWIWARTVRSPNPAYSHIEVPLATSYWLSSRPGREAYVEPVVERDGYRFVVRTGPPTDPERTEAGAKAPGRASFSCVASGAPISGDYIKAEGVAGRLGARLMAVVVETDAGRTYVSPTPEDSAVAASAAPEWRPAGRIPAKLTGGTCVPYGLTEWGDLFTRRQAVALSTISDLLGEVRGVIARDAMEAAAHGTEHPGPRSEAEARAYADAVVLYLSFCLDKATLTNTTLATWQKDPDRLTQAFGRQSIPMTWDFAEANPLSDAGGGFAITAHAVGKVLERLPVAGPLGTVLQQDAATSDLALNRVVSTDPPYYDNIAYADLSDYFYVWLRRSLRDVYPQLFATMAVPKAEELVATAYRHGGRDRAEAFFLEGMTHVMHRLAESAHPAFPVTIYYAFKQSETASSDGTSSTGWETFLEAVIRAGFAINGTWPMRTELVANLKKKVGALASSIVLVCRRRPVDAPVISRREFSRELSRVLPEALDAMTRGADGVAAAPVAPVDLSQAIIGPGMEVFSRYGAVLEADGTPMTVRSALRLINRFLAGDDFDADTQFCVQWFQQHGWGAGEFGAADTLARALGTSVEGVKQAGVVHSAGRVVRLAKWSDYPTDWDPTTDSRMPVWEVLHHLIRVLRTSGEAGAGAILSAAAPTAAATRQLAYRLYTLCERAGRAEDARAYNELITSWTAIEAAAMRRPDDPDQPTLFDA